MTPPTAARPAAALFRADAPPLRPALTDADGRSSRPERHVPGLGSLHRLTHRQREVLALMAEGCSNSAIARILSITERAVVRHASNIYDQLDLPVSDDVHRRVHAVLHYVTLMALRAAK